MRTGLLLIMAGLLLTGCAGNVTPLDETALDDPRPAFLVDHGRHTTLVLTREDDSLVRYLYGEWRWYALEETGFIRGWSTLLWPTQGALGRRELTGPPAPQRIRQQIPVVIQTIHELPVEAEQIDALDRRLEARFDDAIETRHYNPVYDLEFVHDPRDYTLFYNSNHVVADWLRELGLEVQGDPIWGVWRVD